MADISKIKRRLGINDDLQDALIQDLIEDSESMFKIITGETAIEDKYAYMIESVVYKLYNRKGSEGMDSESVDGYSVKYAASLFDEFMPFLEQDFNLDDNQGLKEKGKVVWY